MTGDMKDMVNKGHGYSCGSAGDMAQDLADYDIEMATNREILAWAYKYREQHYLEYTENQIKAMWDDMMGAGGPF